MSTCICILNLSVWGDCLYLGKVVFIYIYVFIYVPYLYLLRPIKEEMKPDATNYGLRSQNLCLLLSSTNAILRKATQLKLVNNWRASVQSDSYAFLEKKTQFRE